MTVAAVSKIPYPSFPFVGHPYIEILSLLDGEKEKKEGRKGRARGRRLGRNFPGGRLPTHPFPPPLTTTGTQLSMIYNL